MKPSDYIARWQDEFTAVRRGKGLGVGKAAEQGRSDEIDAPIGALRGEDGGHDELQRRLVVELAVRIRIGLLQRVEDGPVLRAVSGHGAAAAPSR